MIPFLQAEKPDLSVSNVAERLRANLPITGREELNLRETSP
jgi:hypothetical protein